MPIRLKEEYDVTGCLDCPFSRRVRLGYTYCHLNKQRFDTIVPPKEPPDWCPLRSASVRVDRRVRLRKQSANHQPV